MRASDGVTDCCIADEINAQALRQFQSSHRSPDKPFKPVPDGFASDFDFGSKVLPAGEKE